MSGLRVVEGLGLVPVSAQSPVRRRSSRRKSCTGQESDRQGWNVHPALSSVDGMLETILTIRLSEIVETVAASWPRIRADPRSLADADENGDVGNR